MSARRATRVTSAAVLAATVAAVGLSACGSQPAAKTEAETGRGAEEVGRPATAIIPAALDSRPHAFVSRDVLRPVTNGWRAGSHEQFTEVDAGGLAGNPALGAFAIFRHDFLTAAQKATVVEVQGSGAVRITRAPLGSGVVESAQRNGVIHFAGSRGVRGTLDLSDNSISIRGG
jgi:hypothetical protein